jgi:hypothetical protein
MPESMGIRRDYRVVHCELDAALQAARLKHCATRSYDLWPRFRKIGDWATDCFDGGTNAYREIA